MTVTDLIPASRLPAWARLADYAAEAGEPRGG